MKFYKGDILQHKDGSITQFIRYANHSPDGAVTTKENYRASELKLIRRADEPEWPADVPRCELPLPKGKTRWAYRGIAWSNQKTGVCYYAITSVTRIKKWDLSVGWTGASDRYHYAEAVNDEDYVPPQLSETTNSSQVESKLIATPSVEIERTAKITSPNLSGVEILIQLDGIYVQLDGDCGPFLREEAMTFAELLTAAAKEAQQ